MVFAVLIGLVELAGAVAGPPAEKSEAPAKVARNADGNAQKKSAVTPAEIRDAQVQAAAKLVDLKMVVVERGDFVVRSPAMPMPVPIVFKEVWMHGRSAQVRMDFRDDDQKAQPWWTGFKSLNHPVTTADLASVSGVKECVDLSRELVFADSRGLRPGNRWTLHSVSKSPHFISNLFVPLVECDKPWIATRLRGGLTVADQLLAQPVSHWRVLGDETMGGEEAILVEIAQNDTFTIPLKGHAGGLSMTQGYLAWFSKMHGLMPLRIEQTMRYGYGGREYRLERRPDGMAPLVYVAADFVRFRDVWVPRAGRQTLFVPKEFSPTKSKKFDPDELVDKLIAAGAARFPGERKIGYRREWKILEVGPIDPSLNLWFEPQAGAEVFNTETHNRYIVGNAVASARFAAREKAIAARVGHAAPEFPKGATWLNGEPLTWQALRGKVVILDFWGINCGACHNDLPRLRALYEERGKNGLAVVGVHVAGDDLKAIKKEVDALHLDYPMCIDTPLLHQKGKPEDQPFPSELTAQFGIDAIPHFVVVDRHGVV
ncbi:MAG TPA: TlpA disulfide reductase family protein, partial [Planctomycetaceae bacterium]|nr:TlpA disulfide reductase family protein [Planctomycetaceae bacterium]